MICILTMLMILCKYNDNIIFIKEISGNIFLLEAHLLEHTSTNYSKTMKALLLK